MQEVKPQVGDIWRSGSNDYVDYTVHRTHKGRIAYSYLDDEGVLIGNTYNIDDFITNGDTLIERDGKPYVAPRVFKEGAFYPVVYKSGEQDLVQYDKLDEFDTIGYGTCLLRAFDWIGEELEVKWDV